MLKKIATTDLRLGMFLHALEGPWLSHPFWRSKFLLQGAADLQAVHGSGIGQCWIDTSKGADVPTPEAAVDEALDRTLSQPVPLAEPPPNDDAVPAPSASFEDELLQAARLCRKSKRAMQQMFADVRMGKALQPKAMLPLVEELAESVFRNPGALVSLARLKTKDDYSYMHSVAVCALMVALARQLGMGRKACREAGLAGLLHDVGKALMPLALLNKPGKLSDAEFAVMRAHPLRGHALLAEVGGAGAVALDVCLHHHERIDGRGYPHGLKAEAIAQTAAMGAICDVYDAISSNRPYKAAWDPADSLSRMASWNGHFEPALFAAFVRSLGLYPSGSLVRLRSQRLAVVVKQDEFDLTAPTDKVFFTIRSGLPLPVTQIELAHGSDAIVAREPPGNWDFPRLDELWAGGAALVS